jgi:TPR repeat protein
MPQKQPVSTEAKARSPRWRLRTVLLAATLGVGGISAAHADAVGRATSAYNRGDYIRAASELSRLAGQGNPKASALLGFMYEHGFGAPQAYGAAADLYTQGAVQGNPFAQAMLGLMYDKGHGVPQNFVLAYKWLILAAAHTSGRERDVYLRLRDAVSSKMSPDEIIEGQRLALNWKSERW